MKTKNLLLAFALLISTTSLWAAFPTIQGDGTSTNPYKIGTAAELLEARDSINLSAVTNTMNTAYYQLSNDIDISGTEWVTPIGVAAKNFKGNFDGKGFKITGLFCGTAAAHNLPASATPANLSLGLFGQINGATIKNVEVNLSFYIERTVVTGNLYLGGLVNMMTAGGVCYIDNCRVTGVIYQKNTIESTGANAIEKVGSIVGQVGGTEAYITNCSADVQITNIIVSAGTTNSINSCGGIAGDGGLNCTTSIVNCYSKGSIVIKDDKGATCAGGIVGTRNGTAGTAICSIINCYSSMTIDATESVNTNAGFGGITGLQNNAPNTIKNCIAMNPSIYAKLAIATPVPAIKRIGFKNVHASTVYADNYAISTLDAKTGVSWDLVANTGTLTAVTATNDVAGSDGNLLTGADLTAQIADGLTKLNAYVTANPTYNTIALKSWVAGTTYPMFAPTSPNGLSQLQLLPSLNYSVNAGFLKLNSIEGTKNLKILSIAGNEIENAQVSSSYSIALRKGIYIVNMEGKAPAKVVIF